MCEPCSNIFLVVKRLTAVSHPPTIFVAMKQKEEMTECWLCGRAMLLAGTYGKVFECSDLKYEGSLVAVKIVRDEPLFKKAALNEIKVLKKLDGILPPAFCMLSALRLLCGASSLPVLLSLCLCGRVACLDVLSLLWAGASAAQQYYVPSGIVYVLFCLS